ncbi:MAG: hypothetical protein BJ554DRAFT_3873 [Olpidium bornovanus]|uniref:Uncharacterized protein n=1 Tax=Olpidium bornovanus TaxID=278681 RepID=A0A8H8DFM4_9FUNG|nr:MAG: hypothetical protein BJ554DRAFT_3873 [Olpidium bornovanus]
MQKPWDWTRLHDGKIVCKGDHYVTEVVTRWWNIYDTYISHWVRVNFASVGGCSLPRAYRYRVAFSAVALGLPGELPRFSSPSTHPVPSSTVTRPSGLGNYRVDWNDDDTDVEPVTLPSSLTVADADSTST